MNRMELLVKEIDTLKQELTKEYFDLHMELDKHRGKQLNDTNMPEVIRLVTAIQDTFAQLHPLLYFIGMHHTHAVNLANGYDQFIKDIQKAADNPEINS